MEPSNIAMDFQSPVRGQNADIDEFVTPRDSQNDFGDPSAPSIAVFPSSIDFYSCSGGQLYDQFHGKKKGNVKMGLVGNYVLRNLFNEKNSFTFIPECDTWYEAWNCKLETQKQPKMDQKQLFSRLCDTYPPFLARSQALAVQYVTSQHEKSTARKRGPPEARAPNEAEASLDIEENLLARMLHLVVEEGSKETLAAIFQADQSRAAVDNKKERVKEQWERLCQDYFNNPEWHLELFETDRTGYAGVEIINPSSPPIIPWTGDHLRSTFNVFKSMYTAVYFRFKSSGNNEGGGNPEFEDSAEADDIFYDRFATYWEPAHARALLYAHLLFKGSPPSLVLRLMRSEDQISIGVKGIGADKDYTPLEPKKGKVALKLENFATNFATTLADKFLPAVPTGLDPAIQAALTAQTLRDTEIKEHYALQNLKSKAEAAALIKPFKLSDFSQTGIAGVLRQAFIPENNIPRYVEQLSAQGITNVFHLCQLSFDHLHNFMKFPLGVCLALAKVVSDIDVSTPLIGEPQRC